jgi:hypothetical protein
MSPMSRIRPLLVAALVCLGACGQPTTLLVDVSVRGGDPVPSAVEVGVYGVHGLLARARRDVSALPGRLVVSGLSDADQVLRVVAVAVEPAGVVRGGVRASVTARTQTRVALELSAAVADSDSDGVPDGFDVCAAVADPEQRDSDGDGVGDACPPDTTIDLPTTVVDAADGPRIDLRASIDLGVTECPGTFLLCDGFESGVINPSQWGIGTTPSVSTVELDSTRAFRGTHSVKLGVNMQADMESYFEANINEGTTFPADPTYIRFWLYYPSTFPVLSTGLIKVRQSADPYGGWFLALKDRRFWTGSFYFPGPAERISTTQVPFDRWACIEVMIDNGAPDMGTGGAARVWLDGTELTDLAAPTLYSPVPFGRIYIGQEGAAAPGTPPFAYWIDEVAVDTKPIGCAN